MAGPPVFPGDAKSTGPAGGGDGARGRAGDGDASRLRNLIQSFLTDHDGDRAYEKASASLRQALADLNQAKPAEQRGSTPGRRAAMRGMGMAV
jgi:hypothetical protein